MFLVCDGDVSNDKRSNSEEDEDPPCEQDVPVLYIQGGRQCDVTLEHMCMNSNFLTL